MTREQASLKRKEQMAQSLKKLMAQKNLQQITVQEIADDCGINRYTFYYHFKDIYDLLSWAFQNEALILIQRSDNCLTWQEGFRLFLQHIAENRQPFRRALEGVGEDALRNLFYQEISHLMDLYLSDIRGTRQVSESYCQFMRDFYISALCGVVIAWVQQDMKLTEETVMSYLRPLMDRRSIEESFRQAEQDGL